MEIDLCFVMDCTSSMTGHIEGAKDCIVKVAERVRDMEPAVILRVGFCGYRDHCDGVSRLQTFNFTNSCNDFRNYINANVKAFGGGDGPEDVLGGLNEAVNKMAWRNTTRVLIHVCDYPPHGNSFHNMYDSYPGGDPNGLTPEGVLRDMRSQNILYFFGKITPHTNKMVDEFRKIIGDFLVFDLETVRGNPNALVDKFVNATLTAITTAISLNE
jgi:hypothetical protein